jgi:hypothetical protein
MFALGQWRRWPHFQSMSALPPKADIVHGGANVRFVPKADVTGLYSMTSSAMDNRPDDIVAQNGCPQPMSNHSAAIAIGLRGQDGLGTGCHHFWTPRSLAITLAAL